MKEILETCYLNDCVISFSFEIPQNISICVRNHKLGKWKMQTLPWNHIYDEKILKCVRWIIDEILNDKGTDEPVTLYNDTYGLGAKPPKREFINIETSKNSTVRIP